MAGYPFFPAFVDLSGRRTLVVGGGKIAARRVGTLVQFCPNITVVAPEPHPDVVLLAEAGDIALHKRPFREEDLEGAQLVLACTDDSKLNGDVVAACRARGIPVNDASDRTRCDFLFPGVARRENLVVGVTAGGSDHALARRVTGELRGYLEGLSRADEAASGGQSGQKRPNS